MFFLQLSLIRFWIFPDLRRRIKKKTVALTHKGYSAHVENN